ncbi:MAG: EF-P lysine aminoacylase GenX, partial [Bosea sp.]|nr:EF-P lysine aminoacylase GenX [Bosea sp. (in: a-proteobacteria)]
MNENAPPFWRPDIHADRRPALMARGRVKAALRRWFEARDFIEVEAALLQRSPGNETHLHGFRTVFVDDGGAEHPYYLHTSPEFAAKKLLAAGERRIFDFARVFRNRERTALHHPEFTMLEWYRVGEPYEALMADCAELLAQAARAAGAASLRWRGSEVDPFAEPE